MSRSSELLTVDDVAQACSDQLRKYRKELVEHIERRFQLAEIKKAGSHDETRFNNLHRRLCQVESAIRGIEREVVGIRKAMR